jgi:lysophospholipase L1-like esterase
MRPSPTEGVHFDAEGHAALGRAVSDAVEAMMGKGS